jgi:ubiquitin thioesterase OTU1
MRARLRAPGGASTITLADDATVQDLLSEITSKTSLTSFDIKYGYPPKPLLLNEQEKSLPLSKLDVNLNGEQLTISLRETAYAEDGTNEESTKQESQTPVTQSLAPENFSFTGVTEPSVPSRKGVQKPIGLQKKAMEGDVPELPLPEHGATMGSSLLNINYPDC